MSSELVKTYLQAGSSIEVHDIRQFLSRHDLTDDDVEYLLRYIEDNVDGYFKIDNESMIYLCRLIFLTKSKSFITKFINEESILTPYFLIAGLSFGEVIIFPEKLDLYRKYSFQLNLISAKDGTMGHLKPFESKSTSHYNNIYSRLYIECLTDTLKFTTLNRLYLIIEDLIKYRDKSSTYIFIYNLFALKDIDNRINKYLLHLIKEFCDPNKRRLYNSKFLKEIYGYMDEDFKFNFHTYIEELYDSSTIDKDNFKRFNKAYMESSDI